MRCLDVLIHLPVQGGQEKYGGENMDAVQRLLDFMEKRIDKVRPAVVALLSVRAAHGGADLSSSQGSNYKEGLTPVLSLLTEGSRCHREIRRYIKAQVGGGHRGGSFWHRPEQMSLSQASVQLKELEPSRLRLQVLPPLKDVKVRPEVGSTLRNKLVRLMTHVDMGVKQTAAEFLFVLCKESGERPGGCRPSEAVNLTSR